MNFLKARKLFITGAAGSGATTLGRHLAAAIGAVHVDSDDYYWVKTDPPFQIKNPPKLRVELISEALGAKSWVLSGSLDGWGDRLIISADLIVYQFVPHELRMARLHKREAGLFGDRILPGGDMHNTHVEFMAWAAKYDDPNFSGRSRYRHERWLDQLGKPVLKLDGLNAISELCDTVLNFQIIQ